MTETVAPACRSAVASCQTRRSNGTGRFSTMISTLRPASGCCASSAAALAGASLAASSSTVSGDAAASGARYSIGLSLLRRKGGVSGHRVDVEQAGCREGEGSRLAVQVDDQVVPVGFGVSFVD